MQSDIHKHGHLVKGIVYSQPLPRKQNNGKRKKKTNIRVPLAKRLRGASETENFPALKGGLGILDVGQQCLALRTKHLLQIQELEPPHKSFFFQKYLLAMSLSGLANIKYPQWRFFTKNDFPKTLNSLPFYYRDVIESLKNNLPIFELKPKSTKNIYLHLTNAQNNRDIENTEKKRCLI